MQNGAPAKPKGPPLVSVAAIVGGMSAQKQRRILDRGVDVLVATPGRLWDILQEVRATDSFYASETWLTFLSPGCRMMNSQMISST